MKISTTRTIIVLACFLVAFFLLQNVTGTQRTSILQPLSSFPEKIDRWHMKNARLSSDAVISMLGVDDYFDYSYRTSDGKQVNMYVAYYESVGTGGGYHSPKNCLPGGGWGISHVEKVVISPATKNKPVEITKMIIKNRSEYQVVYYWYQNRGRIIHSEYWEKIYLVLDAIFKGRRDGSFVRLMVYAGEDNIDQAEESLNEFAALIIPELEKFIPGS